jgi:AcrR family transcriptional regulator
VWGNPDARRRDILAAAATIVETGGYAALTMRAVAAGPNVSPGTIYQYFHNKAELFSHLMVDLIDGLRVALDALPAGTGTSGVLRAALPHIVEQWRCIGSTAASWAPELVGPGPAATMRRRVERDARRSGCRPTPRRRARRPIGRGRAGDGPIRLGGTDRAGR